MSSGLHRATDLRDLRAPDSANRHRHRTGCCPGGGRQAPLPRRASRKWSTPSAQLPPCSCGVRTRQLAAHLVLRRTSPSASVTCFVLRFGVAACLHAQSTSSVAAKPAKVTTRGSQTFESTIPARDASCQPQGMRHWRRAKQLLSISADRSNSDARSSLLIIPLAPVKSSTAGQVERCDGS